MTLENEFLGDPPTKKICDMQIHLIWTNWYFVSRAQITESSFPFRRFVAFFVNHLTSYKNINTKICIQEDRIEPLNEWFLNSQGQNVYLKISKIFEIFVSSISFQGQILLTLLSLFSSYLGWIFLIDCLFLLAF
jgi:hypothetical protein